MAHPGPRQTPGCAGKAAAAARAADRRPHRRFYVRVCRPVEPHPRHRCQCVFGFGFYFIGVYILNVDIYTLIFGSLTPSLVLICGPVMDCGVAWTPLFADLVSLTGLPMTVIIIVGMLYCFFKYRLNPSIHSQIFCYWCFLFLISVPVGKFGYISPSNLLLPLIAIMLYYMKFDRLSKCV